MSDNRQIYEVANLMTGQNDIRAEIYNSVKQVLQDKYINKINKAVESQFLSTKANPPKEIRLMQVMKDFCPANRHAQIDQAIRLMTVMSTYRNLRSNLNGVRPGHMNIQSQDVDHSIHEDGIYDVDTACYIRNESKKTDILSTLMMMMFMGNESI